MEAYADFEHNVVVNKSKCVLTFLQTKARHSQTLASARVVVGGRLGTAEGLRSPPGEVADTA